MASIHALTAHLVPNESVSGKARVVNLSAAPVSRATAQETYYIEDGWVFREHHGKYVECICRTSEIPAATAQAMPVFQLR